MKSNEEKIKELCSAAEADIRLCWVVYTIIDKAPEVEKAALLESFIIGYKNTPSDHSLELPHFMSNKQKNNLLKRYGRQVDKRMVTIQNMGLSENAFYEKLWKYISTTPALPTFESRVIALYNCVIDERLPYYKVDHSAALTMEQEVYESFIASIGDRNLGRMKFILKADFSQRTEQASLIMQMIDACESFEERTVFLSRVIACLKTEFQRMELRNFASVLNSEGNNRSPFSLDDDEDILEEVLLFDDEDGESDDPDKPYFG